MSTKKKIALLTTLASLTVGLVIVLVLLIVWNTFGQTDQRKVLTALSDAFFIGGFIIFGIGGLAFIASTGFFDTLSYGFISIWYLFIKWTYKKGEHEKYYDYVERKRELREKKKDRAFSLYIILVGIFLIIIAAIFIPFVL